MQSPRKESEGIIHAKRKELSKFFYKKSIKITNWVLKLSAKYSIIRLMYDGYLPSVQKSRGNDKFLKEKECIRRKISRKFRRR